MHRPVLVTPPEELPVSVSEAKLHLRVSHSDEDTLIEGLIKAAAAHLDGWTGILGRCLVTQTWRQDFDSSAARLPLPLGPVSAIDAVTIDGDPVDSGDYALRTDAAGRSCVAFAATPAAGAVSVTYTAGYEVIPDPIRVAILLLVGAWYENREETAIGVSVASLPAPVSVAALIEPYRQVGF